MAQETQLASTNALLLRVINISGIPTRRARGSYRIDFRCSLASGRVYSFSAPVRLIDGSTTVEESVHAVPLLSKSELGPAVIHARLIFYEFANHRNFLLLQAMRRGLTFEDVISHEYDLLPNARRSFRGTTSSMPPGNQSIKIGVSLFNTDLVRFELMAKIPEQGLAQAINFSTIFRSLQHVSKEVYFPYLPDSIVDDGLKDAHELVESFVTRNDSEEYANLLEEKSSLTPLLFNGCKFSFLEDNFSRHNPIEENSVRIILSEDGDATYYSFTFANRYIMWKWFYCLKNLIQVWRCEVTNDDEATTSASLLNTLTCPGVSVVYNDPVAFPASVTPLDGTLSVDVDRPFTLKHDQKELDIARVTALVLAQDAYTETGASIHLSVEKVEALGCLRPAGSFRPSVGAMASAMAHIAEDATVGAASRAKHAVLSTASLFKNVLNHHGSAHPEHIKEGDDEDDGSSRKSQNYNNTSGMKIAMKYLGGTTSIEETQFARRSLQLDYFEPTTKMMASSIRFPYERGDALLFLYQDAVSQPVAAKILEYETIEAVAFGKTSAKTSNVRERLGRLITNFNSPEPVTSQDISLSLDCQIELLVTIVRAEGIVLPAVERRSFTALRRRSKELPSQQSSHSITSRRSLGSRPSWSSTAESEDNGATTVSAKCRLVDDRRKMLADLGHHFSGVYSPEEECVEWSNASLLFPLREHIESARYVRIELTSSSLPVSSLQQQTQKHADSLGAIFIPLAAFTHHEKELVFPLDDLRRKHWLQPAAASASSTLSLAASRGPTVTVMIQAITQKFTPKSASSSSSTTAAKEISSTVGSQSPQLLGALIAKHYSCYEVWHPCDVVLSGELASTSGGSSSMTSRILLNSTGSSERLDAEQTHVRFGKKHFLVETSLHVPIQTGHHTSPTSSWRQMILAAHPHALLRTSETATAENSQVVLPYTAITAVEVISPGIICISATVQRYLCAAITGSKPPSVKTSHDEGKFVPVTMHFFVTNCKAKELSLLLEDRRFFAEVRRDFLGVLLNGLSPESPVQESVEGVPNNNSCKAADAVVLSIEIDHLAGRCLEEVTNVLKAAFRADQQQQQSQTLSSIDSVSTPRLPRAVWTLVRLLGSRECRLKMYEAALYGIGLPSTHAFDMQRIQAVIAADVKECHALFAEGKGLLSQSSLEEKDADDAHSTTSEDTSNSEMDEADRFAARCHFLLATAENRIRETAISGWSRRGEGLELEQCLVLLIEGYFNALLNLIRPLMVREHFEQIKGLSSKKKHVLFLLQQHTAFQSFLVSALRPYQLHVSPEPTVDSFVPYHVLVQWYHESLARDMLLRLRSVLRVWRNDALQQRSSNNETKHSPKTDSIANYEGSKKGNSDSYTCDVVPWLPQREFPRAGVFFSHIPEDLVAMLVVYLRNSVLGCSEEDRIVHPKFANTIPQQSAEAVLRSYIETFGGLQRAYVVALAGRSALGNSGDAEVVTGSIHGARNAYFQAFVQNLGKLSINTSTTVDAALPNASSVLSGSPEQQSATATTTAADSSSSVQLLLSTDDMVAEYATWVCSVANDCYRISRVRMIEAELPEYLVSTYQSSPVLVQAADEVYADFMVTADLALEQLATMIFHCVLQERKECTFDQLLQAALRCRPLTPATTSEILSSDVEDGSEKISSSHAPGHQHHLHPLAEDVLACLLDFGTFLDPAVVHRQLLPICQRKLCRYLLSLLRAMRNRGIILSPISDSSVTLPGEREDVASPASSEVDVDQTNDPLRQLLILEIDAIERLQTKLLETFPLSEANEDDDTSRETQAQDLVVTILRLVRALVLDLEHGHDGRFIATFKELAEYAHRYPADAAVIVRFLKVVLSLRGHKRYFTASVAMHNVVVGAGKKRKLHQQQQRSPSADRTSSQDRPINTLESTSSPNRDLQVNSKPVDQHEQLTNQTKRHASGSSFWSQMVATFRGHSNRATPSTTPSHASNVLSSVPEGSIPASTSDEPRTSATLAAASYEFAPNVSTEVDSEPHVDAVIFSSSESRSGRFTAETITLRDRLHEEWVNAMMDDLTALAEQYATETSPSAASKAASSLATSAINRLKMGNVSTGSSTTTVLVHSHMTSYVHCNVTSSRSTSRDGQSTLLDTAVSASRSHESAVESNQGTNAEDGDADKEGEDDDAQETFLPSESSVDEDLKPAWIDLLHSCLNTKNFDFRLHTAIVVTEPRRYHVQHDYSPPSLVPDISYPDVAMEDYSSPVTNIIASDLEAGASNAARAAFYPVKTAVQGVQAVLSEVSSIVVTTTNNVSGWQRIRRLSSTNIYQATASPSKTTPAPALKAVGQATSGVPSNAALETEDDTALVSLSPYRRLMRRAVSSSPSKAQLSAFQPSLSQNNDEEAGVIVAQRRNASRSVLLRPVRSISSSANQFRGEDGKAGFRKVVIKSIRIHGTMRFLLFAAPRFALRFRIVQKGDSEHLAPGSADGSSQNIYTVTTKAVGMTRHDSSHNDTKTACYVFDEEVVLFVDESAVRILANATGASQTCDTQSADATPVSAATATLDTTMGLEEDVESGSSRITMQRRQSMLQDLVHDAATTGDTRTIVGPSSTGATASSIGEKLPSHGLQLEVALLDAGVLVDQYLASLSLSLLTSTNATQTPSHPTYRTIHESEQHSFTKYSSALRVQRIVRQARMQSRQQQLPQVSFSLSVI